MSTRFGVWQAGNGAGLRSLPVNIDQDGTKPLRQKKASLMPGNIVQEVIYSASDQDSDSRDNGGFRRGES